MKRALGWTGAVILLGACGGQSDDDFSPAPLSAGQDEDDDESGDGDGEGTTAGSTGGTGGVPAHCQENATDGGEEEESDSGDGDDGDDGPVLDVGAPTPLPEPVTCEEVVGTLTNLGCEFWAVDLPNDWRGTDSSPPASEQQFSIVVANPSGVVEASVEVFVGDESTPIESVSVPVDGTSVIALEANNINPEANSTDGLAYRIESDVPVTAYQFNPLDNTVEVYSNDASVLLPTHALGPDYMAVTSNAILLAMSPADPTPVLASAFVSMVATEDDTTIEVFPTDPILPGDTIETIDRGEVFTILSELGETDAANLSGTRVAADKPVAVFAGNVGTAIPLDGGCCADHIEQQMFPLDAWGTAYSLAPPPDPDGGVDPARYRILAAFDDTELLYCPDKPPAAPTSVSSGKGFEFESMLPFTVRSADPDKPISVTQFLQSSNYLEAGGQDGDPAMLHLPGVVQHERKVVFAVPVGYARNYVTVVGPSLDVSLDGEAIEVDAFEELGVANGVLYHYTTQEIDAGSHVLLSDQPIGVSVIGLDDFVSYGFPGGMGLRVVAPVPPAD